MIDYSIKIGGEAGQGLQSIGFILSKALSRAGYHIFTVQDYESRIRGGHSVFYLRVSDQIVEAARAPLSVLVALNQATLDLHRSEMAPDGLIVFNSDVIKNISPTKNMLALPLDQLALEAGNKLFANSVATGAIMGLVGCDFDILESVLKEFFSGKQADIAEHNAQAARSGFDAIQKLFPQCQFPLGPKTKGERMILTGSEAVALGALAAGCKFYSGYPMTPSTGILNYMAHAASSMGVVVEQAEDEIAAINMALGASYAGVRAMTATAGGGFALMVEGLSLAAMTETPIVIGLAQRPAPATGLPTRTEQGDLEYALYAGHGEFPRAIFTPGNAEQCFYLTAQAFKIAEKYQIPAFVLTDQYLADMNQDFDRFDTSRIDNTRYIMTDTELAKITEYNRYALTPDGISPRALPGQSKHLVVVDSDEHTPDGHLTEDLKVRVQMVDKRLSKYNGLLKEVIAPTLEVNPKPETLLVCWGSNYGVVKEVAQMFNKEKSSGGLLHFQQVWPFPKDEFTRSVQGVKQLIVIENNATGQLARLIKRETNISNEIKRINKYNGLPFSVDELYRLIKEIK